MSMIAAAPWIAVIVPLLVAPVAATFGRKWRWMAPFHAGVAALAALLVGVSSLLAVPEYGELTAPWTSPLISSGSLRWFTAGEASIRLGWGVDSLAAVMLTVVGVVALCVVVFSVGYMHGERGWARYFGLIALFTAAMSLLVIGDSFATLFVGWELVGACSYLLIGFWYEKPSAAAAAVKAFLTTRVGDVGLLIGMAVLWSGTGTLAYSEVLANTGVLSSVLLAAAAIGIAVGAMGKSAQFPLHAWLPDAMEGPTPVSALIHAATMVAAGVFLVARVWPLFEASPEARLVLLGAGAISAFGAALAALPQRDIKKVLAYSTVSQLGFMFCALGVGAWSAAFFHLVTHAAFKALLFLASGSVIHGSGTQDLHEMGGLRRPMKVTFAVWLIGVLALAGMIPFAGFFSKDAVLEAVFHQAPAIGVLLFGASALTAFYCARSTRLAFFGEPAEGLHVHESGLSMLLPLLVLAVPAMGLGFLAPQVAELLGHEAEPLALGISAAAVGLAVLGGTAGWMLSAGPKGDRATATAAGSAWDFFGAAYRWDELISRLVVRPAVAACRSLWAVGDRMIADGVPEGSARFARRTGSWLSTLQSGDGQSYAALLAIGVFVMLLATAWLGR